MTANSFRLVHLYQNQPSVLFAKASEVVSPSANRTHEVQPEAIDIRESPLGVEFCVAANAFPHAVILAVRRCSAVNFIGGAE